MNKNTKEGFGWIVLILIIFGMGVLFGTSFEAKGNPKTPSKHDVDVMALDNNRIEMEITVCELKIRRLELNRKLNELRRELEAMTEEWK